MTAPVNLPCGKQHRTWAAHLPCVFGSTLNRSCTEGEGPWAIGRCLNISADRGRRWRAASRTHVHLLQPRGPRRLRRDPPERLAQRVSGTHIGTHVINLA